MRHIAEESKRFKKKKKKIGKTLDRRLLFGYNN